MMYYSGGTSHKRGVGVLLNKQAQNPEIGRWPTTDRALIFKSKEITIVMGDFNATVGIEKHAMIAGGKGIGSRNERDA